jgi:nucleoside-diphosphate-sugar epimerase
LRLFVFGYGYSARALVRTLAPAGWTAVATVRTDDAAARAVENGVQPVRTDDAAAITAAAKDARAILITAPPGPDGCPALPVLAPALARTGAFPDWIGYLSTTGVYGDRRGRWVFETSRLAAQSIEGARRVAAERDWQEVARGMGLTLTVFRLPGIYGPGRSAFDRLREGRARSIAAPGHVFSRIHVEDLARGLAASMARPRAGGVYNLCDDEPAPNSEVVAYAARLLGLPPPSAIPLAEANLPPAAMRFYAESKRVSNARAKAELGWRPVLPTYREGLASVLAAGG